VKISTKLYCGCIAVGLLLCLQSAASYKGFSLIHDKMNFCINNSGLIDAAMEMKYAAARDMQLVMEILASESLDEFDAFWAQHNKFSTTFEVYAGAITDGAEIDGEKIVPTLDTHLKQQVIAIADLHKKQFTPPLNLLCNLKRDALQGKIVDSAKLESADKQVDMMGEEIFSRLGNIEKDVKEVIEQDKAEALDSIAFGNRILYSVTGCGLFFAAILGISLSRAITRPIGHALRCTQAVAEGDLTHTLKAKNKDEIGQMATALNGMVNKLSSMLKEIIGNAEQLHGSSQTMTDISGELFTAAGRTATKSTLVASAAEEMSTSVQTLATAMEQSSSNISMVAASSEEMTSTIKEIAQNAERARNVSEGAVQQSHQASKKMNILGQAARRISQVTEAITEISEQTNLLALNATIEAARAGQAGRGFAVVANEIKELAHQTSQATVDIKNQIHEMQDITTTAVTDIGQISQVIEEISCVINGIASAVEEQTAASSEIADNINQASLGIQEVSFTIQESSERIGQISFEISDINQQSTLVGDNSQLVQTNARELETLAEGLNELVLQFKIHSCPSELPISRVQAKEEDGSCTLHGLKPVPAVAS